MLVTAVVWWRYRWLRGGDGGGVMVSAVVVLKASVGWQRRLDGWGGARVEWRWLRWGGSRRRWRRVAASGYGDR
ncbi:hypothetical protein Tco_1552069, partial [Tanacetum coccineum]